MKSSRLLVLLALVMTADSATIIPEGSQAISEVLKTSDYAIDAVYEYFLNKQTILGRYTEDSFTRRCIMSIGVWFRQTDLTGIHHYDDPQAKLISGGPEHQTAIGRREQSKKCRSQLTSIFGKLDKGEHLFNSSNIESFVYFDSFGRRESGTGQGKTVWMGSYFSCTRLQISIDTNDRSQHKSIEKLRYCMAIMYDKQWPVTPGYDIGKYGSFKLGVCLPKSCDSTGAESSLDLVDALIKRIGNDPIINGLSTQSVYCLPDDESPLRQWSKDPVALNLVVFLSVWLALLITCSFADGLGDSPQNWKFISWFSVARHVRHLFRPASGMSSESRSSGKHQSPVSLGPLEGVKAILMLLIVLAHMWVLQGITHLGADYIIMYEEMYSYLLVLSGGLAVNIFLTVTGIVTAYTILKSLSISRMLNPIVWILISLYRYMRIVPIWLITVWIAKSFIHLGSGPMWDYGTSNTTTAHICRTKNTWTSVLTASSFTEPLLERCLPTDWYLSLDLLFAISVAPIYLVALVKLPARYSYSVAPISIFIGTCYTFYKICTSVADLTPMSKGTISTFLSFVLLLLGEDVPYASPIVRAPCFIIGCTIGHWVYQYEIAMSNSSSTSNTSAGSHIMTKLCQIPGRIVLAVSIACLCSSQIFFLLMTYARIDLNVNILIAIRFSLLYFMYFPVALLTLPQLISCRYKILSQFFSHTLWRFLSRMGLAVLLVHVLIIVYYYSSLTQVLSITPMMFIVTEIAIVCMSYVAAFLLCILIESPMKSAQADLIKMILDKVDSQSNRQTSDGKEKQEKITERPANSNSIVVDKKNSDMHQKKD